MKNTVGVTNKIQPDLREFKGLAFLFFIFASLVAAAIFLIGLSGNALASSVNPPRMLSPSGWTITDLNGNSLTNLTDNNPATFAAINNGTHVPGILINLGSSTIVHRVYLTGPTINQLAFLANQGNSSNLPLGVIMVYVGNTGTAADTLVAQYRIPFNATNANNANQVDTEMDIRFQPTSGQYVRMELQTAVPYSEDTSLGGSWCAASWCGFYTNGAQSNLAWDVGEIELYGFPGVSSTFKQDAVVWPGYGTITESQITSIGLNWSSFENTLTTNGWAVQTSSTTLAMIVDVDLYRTQMSAVFASSYSAVYSILGSNPNVITSRDKVAALTLAAKDLSYYLSEMEGKPVPMITSSQASQYPGTLYTITDLSSLAPNYNTMVSNIQSGALPTTVINVTQSGNVVTFTGWPYYNVLTSVWEFLGKQGVHWVYPDGHGDAIPDLSGTGINLGILPLNYNPSAQRIQAGFDVPGFLAWPGYYKQTINQSYLYFWRNGWNSTQNAPVFWSGAEVPTQSLPALVDPSSQYTEGFYGYPGNFSNVIPDRIMALNTDWCGTEGCEPPDSNTFNMSLPPLIQWVGNKMAAWAPTMANNMPNYDVVVGQTGAVSFAQGSPVEQMFTLMPMDAASFDQSSGSTYLNDSSLTTVPWNHLYSTSQSGAYFNFVNQVAQEVAAQSPNTNTIVDAMAYADTWNPPQKICSLSTSTNQWTCNASSSTNKLASNVQVELCMWGSSNLLINAPENAALKQGFLTWHSLASRLNTYDYTLLFVDYFQPIDTLPVPMISAMVDRAQFLNSIGALDGLVQAGSGNNSTNDMSSMMYNPWDYFAYPRIRMDLTQTASMLINNFINGYFGQAASPMLSYYETMENWQVQNNVNMHWWSGFDYGVMPATFPNQVLAQMQTDIQQAQGQDSSWVVQMRLANMQTELNWVIAQRGLTGINLSDTSLYPQLGVNAQPVTLNLSTGFAPNWSPVWNYGYLTSCGTNCTYWKFWSTGDLSLPVNFTQAGVYQITVNAQVEGNGANIVVLPGTMNVYVGPNIYPVSITSQTAANYVINATVPAGFGVQDIHVQTPGPGGFAVNNISVSYTGAGTPSYGKVLPTDTAVTIYDAELTAQEAIGISVPNFNATAAEVDGTGKVDIYDSFLIAEYAVGLITQFPM